MGAVRRAVVVLAVVLVVAATALAAAVYVSLRSGDAWYAALTADVPSHLPAGTERPVVEAFFAERHLPLFYDSRDRELRANAPNPADAWLGADRIIVRAT